MSTPGYLSNSALAAKVAAVVDRWNTRENQMIAFISQPNGTVIVTDGLGNDHELSSFPQLQKDVQALLTQLGAGIENVEVMIDGVQVHAEAAQAAQALAATNADDAATSASNAATNNALAQAAKNTAESAAAASGNNAASAVFAASDAQTQADNAAASASAAAASATAAASAHTAAQTARDTAQGYVEQVQDIVDNAGNVISVAGRHGAVVLTADDIESGTFAPARIPALAISKITDLQTTLEGKLPADYVPTWEGLDGKPDAFTPAPHTHPVDEIVGLQAALAAKRATHFFFNQL